MMGFSWIKIGIGFACALALAAIIGTILHWRSQAHTLGAWQTQVISKVTEATVEPGKDGKKKLLTPDSTLAALDGLIAERDEARRMLGLISRQAAADKARSDAHDLDLERQQATWVRKLESSKRQINRLMAMKSTGDLAADQALISTESEAAWRGWQ